MVIREFIDTVVSALSGGVQSDDRTLHPKLVYNAMTIAKTTLITNKENKKQKISDFTYKTLPCVEIIEVDASLCPCLPPRGCTVKRSKYKIPEIVSNLSYLSIRRVATADLMIEYSYSSPKGLKFSKGNKYSKTKDQNKYMISNGYIYLYGNNIPPYIFIEAIFKNELEVFKFNDKNCKSSGDNLGPCDSFLDQPLGIDSSLEKTLLDMTTEYIRNNFLRSKADNITTNNTEDN